MRSAIIKSDGRGLVLAKFSEAVLRNSNADAENLPTFRRSRRAEGGQSGAFVQPTFQIPDLLLLFDSEDVHRATDVAGMTHLQFSGSPRGSGRVSPHLGSQRKVRRGECESSRSNLH